MKTSSALETKTFLTSLPGILAGLRTRQVLFLIILFGILIRIPLLGTPLTYANDAWREADTASIARHFYKNGYNLLYPQIYWGGDGPGYVATEFQLYPLLLALLYSLFGEHLWFGRLVSLLFTIPTFYLFYLFAQRVTGSKTALWALFFFTMSPLGIRYSVAYMPEAVLLFFFVAALYYFHIWIETGRLPILLLAAACTALGVLEKPTALILGPIFACMILEKFGLRSLKRIDLWIFAAISLIPGVWWYAHAHNIYLQYGNSFGILEGDTKFGDFSYWLSSEFYVSTITRELKWVFAGLPVVLFGIGLVQSFKIRPARIIIYSTITIWIYYFLIARAAEKWYSVHYHLLSLPIAALGIALGVSWVLAQNSKKWIYRLVLLTSILSILFVTFRFYQSRLGVEDNWFVQKEIECAHLITKLVPEDARIIISSPTLNEENGRTLVYQEPIIFFYSDRYGWSLAANQHNPQIIQSMLSQGAKYFVIYDNNLLKANPDLVSYLDNNAVQVGPGIEARCGIYQFK